MSTKIACLSDTHGTLDERIIDFIGKCDEVWHAGDIGNIAIAEKLLALKPLRAVYGNIDDYEIRRLFPLYQRFFCEDVDVLITHIGGYPGNYDKSLKSIISEMPPGLLICGHSHILKVMNDESAQLLYINPGAAGKSGQHQVQTAVRFVIDRKNISELEIIELEREGRKLF